VPPLLETLALALPIGAGATAATDVWAAIRKVMFGVSLPDYGLVGRWLAYLPSGRFRHDPIAASPSVPGERLAGWAAHYLTGVAYAALLLAIWGADWARRPTIGPALTVGIGTVVVPLFLIQPLMGAGFASSRAPRPAVARIKRFIMHAIFGLGLYGAGWVVKGLMLSAAR
jgi:hypothetical protein